MIKRQKLIGDKKGQLIGKRKVIGMYKSCSVQQNMF